MQQSAAMESQAAETNAAHATASKLGRMMNDLRSASDFAPEAFEKAIEIADVVTQNIRTSRLKDCNVRSSLS